MSSGRQRSQPRKRAAQIAAAAAVFLACGWGFAAVLHWQIGPIHGQALEFRSANFADGGAIPRWFTCDAAGVSPGLEWPAVPLKTKSLAIVVDDPDAPFDFTHWLVYNIPADARALAENARGQSAMPEGAIEGANSYGRAGYAGPCPPADQLHHYYFHLYALDARLNLPAGATRKQIDAAIAQHILAQGQTIGIYRRSGP
jgi:Raf kinase inhibitor-like YbhB/YbcL family protein